MCTYHIISGPKIAATAKHWDIVYHIIDTRYHLPHAYIPQAAQ